MFKKKTQHRKIADIHLPCLLLLTSCLSYFKQFKTRLVQIDKESVCLLERESGQCCRAPSPKIVEQQRRWSLTQITHKNSPKPKVKNTRISHHHERDGTEES